MQFRQSRQQVFVGRPKIFAKSQKSIKERENYEGKPSQFFCEYIECSFYKLA